MVETDLEVALRRRSLADHHLTLSRGHQAYTPVVSELPTLIRYS